MRSLRTKLVMIMVILILALMCVIGAFLINGVGNFYISQFYEQMEKNLGEKTGYGNLDLKLHMQIAKATHNDIFPILVHTLYESSGQRIVLMEDIFPESMRSIHRDHLGIIEAIKRRDVKGVRKVGKRHFDVDRYMLLSMNGLEENSK